MAKSAANNLMRACGCACVYFFNFLFLYINKNEKLKKFGYVHTPTRWQMVRVDYASVRLSGR